MYTRHLKDRIWEAIEDTPIVFLNGARQVGKSTLMQEIAQQMHAEIYSLDDPITLSAIKVDPAGFIHSLKGHVFIDEIQRAPNIIPPLKQKVDLNRQNKNIKQTFLLTGSADYFTLPHVTESMAGRMEIKTMWPLSSGEIQGHQSAFLKALFQEREFQKAPSVPVSELWSTMIMGGYPEVWARKTHLRRQAWLSSYLEALIQKDLRELMAVESLESVRFVLEALAGRSAGLLNIADLSRTLAHPLTNLKRYIALLQNLFLIYKLQPWFINTDKRLTKTPKIYFVDSGLLVHLSRVPHEYNVLHHHQYGHIYENYVVSEIMKQISMDPQSYKAYHFRTHQGDEVDLVVEDPLGRIAGVEIKLTQTLQAKDFHGLKTLQALAGSKFQQGIILYTGDKIIPFSEHMRAIPFGCL